MKAFSGHSEISRAALARHRSLALTLAAILIGVLLSGCGGGTGERTPPAPGPGPSPGPGPGPGPGPAPGPGTIPIPIEFNRQEPDAASYPDALCNDGTRAVFYLQAGHGDNAALDANKTVIFLDGGGYCYSDDDCRGRTLDLTSSNSYPAIGSFEGLLSNGTENPFFRSWNRVMVPYCTSDAFSGDVGPTGGSTNFQFRGSKVVAAVVQTLNSRYGIGKAGDVVMFGGSSAGAIGAFINANRVRAMLPGASVLTVLDAGLFPDVQPPTTQPAPASSARAIAALTLSYWNAQLDSDCLAANPGNPSFCLLFQYATPTLRMPVFVAQNTADPSSIANVGFFTPNPGRDSFTNTRWINRTFLPAMTQILGPQGLASAQSLFNVCDPGGVHTETTTTSHWTRPWAPLGNVTLQQAVATWAASGGSVISRAQDLPCDYP